MLENKVELFENQLEVIKRIEELKKEGYEEDDMYIIVDDDEEISMLKGSTGVMIKEEDDSLLDRFKSFLTGNDSITDAFNRMDLDEDNRDACYEEVQNGKILLMVNKNYESKFELTEDGLMIQKEDLEYKGEDLELNSSGIAVDVDEDMLIDSKESLPDDIKRDIGFGVSEHHETVNTLINEQIAEDDFHDR